MGYLILVAELAAKAIAKEIPVDAFCSNKNVSHLLLLIKKRLKKD